MDLQPQQKEQYYVMFINLETPKKEQSSVMFKNQFPTTHQKISNLRNLIESNQCIDYNMCNSKNRHPHQDLPQTCVVSKYVCTVWIWPTANFLSQPMLILLPSSSY